jgi:lipoate-protein ligase A
VTGGRALYHDPSELTYAVAANTDDSPSSALSSGLSKSSEAIAMALAAFLARLNVHADYVRASAPGHNRPEIFHKAPCFASAARHELVVAGRKVVASAQKRLGSSFLQHGSIKLQGVASHPALGDLEADGSIMQSIDSESFTRMALIFREAVGKSLGVDFADVAPSDTDLGEIEMRADSVKKNRFEKRLIIAQKRRATSL